AYRVRMREAHLHQPRGDRCDAAGIVRDRDDSWHDAREAADADRAEAAPGLSLAGIGAARGSRDPGRVRKPAISSEMARFCSRPAVFRRRAVWFTAFYPFCSSFAHRNREFAFPVLLIFGKKDG